MQCLDMPARTFFSVLKNGREAKNKELYFFLHELCDVSVCGNVQDYKYVSQIKEVYRNNFLDIKPKVNPRLFNMEDAKERKDAANVLFAFFKQKKKMEGLDGR